MVAKGHRRCQEEIGDVEGKSLADFITSSYPFIWIRCRTCILPGIRELARKRYQYPSHEHRDEKKKRSFWKYMFAYNRDFAPEDRSCGMITTTNTPSRGGDVLVLNSETVAIGLSQRTTASAIERFAENMLNKSTF